jgi:hypothetical protein
MGDPDVRDRLMQIVSTARPEMVAADTEAIFAAIGDDPAASPGPKVCVGYASARYGKTPITGAVAEPSDGLEPSTPSLPWRCSTS